MAQAGIKKIYIITNTTRVMTKNIITLYFTKGERNGKEKND